MSRTTPSMRRATPARAKRALKSAYGTTVSLASTVRHRGLDPSAGYLVLGTGRSGTTLLQQLVTALPDTMPVYEPLRRGEDRRLPRAVPDNGGFLPGAPSGTDARDLEAWWTSVFAARHLTWWSASQTSSRQLWGAERVVVKEIRANRIAGWLATTFPTVRTLGIVRHPCAVISSMLSAPGIWNDWTRDEIVEPLRRHWPELDLDDVLAGSTRHGWLAAFWAADTRCLLDAARQDHVLVLSYEDLVTTPVEVIDAVFRHLGRETPPNAAHVLGTPSPTANASAAIRTGAGLLGGWRERIETAQTDEILRITHALGFTSYTQDPEPVGPLPIDSQREA